MDVKSASKSGNGSFRVERDALIRVWIEGEMAQFTDWQHAYDWCCDGHERCAGTMRGFSYLNATHALEDMF